MQGIGSWILVVSMQPRMQDFKQAIQFWKHLPKSWKDAVGSPVLLLQQRIGCIQVWVKRFYCVWLNMFCCSTFQFNSTQFNSIQFNSIQSKRASFKCFSRVQSIGGSVCSRSSEQFSTVPTCCRSFQVVALFSSESRWRLCCGAWLTSSSDGAWSGVGDEEIWLTYLSRREWCSSRYNLFDAQRYFLSRLAFPSNQK